MRKLILILSLQLAALVSIAQFRVIGYLPVGAGFRDSLPKLPFSKITHLNLAFINPDSTGNFMQMGGLDSLVFKAHNARVKVCMSIGGGNPPPYFHHLLQQDMRDSLIFNLMKFVNINRLDGVDVDLEGSFIDENYDVFLTSLGTALKLNKKFMSIAIATTYGDNINDHALAQPDFINIMSYDKTGPWTADHPGEHSPYSMALQDIEYWATTRGVPRTRLSLGVPFYGYQFAGSVVNDVSFSEIVALNSSAINNDVLIMQDNSVIYYNGVSTIRTKAQLARQQLGGIMIWQLLQDASGAASLLNVIDQVVKAGR